MVASNLPGLILHIWLNSGASRLQYQELSDTRRESRETARQWDASSPDEEDMDGIEDANLSVAERLERENAFVICPQEQLLLRLLSAWAVVLVYCAWFSRADPAQIVGYVVNVNLIVFYGAPLQVMRTVIETSNAESIHTPTMMMNWVSSSDVWLKVPYHLAS